MYIVTVILDFSEQCFVNIYLELKFLVFVYLTPTSSLIYLSF